MADAAAPQTLASPGRKRQKIVAPPQDCEKEKANAVVLSNGKREEENEVFLHQNQEQNSRESSKPLEVSNEVVLVCPNYGVTSVCGRRRDMEDAVSVHGSFSNKSHFFGVFDGHGCSHVAMKCKDRLHEIVKEEVEGKGEGVEWKVTMEKSFDRMDKEVQESSGPVMGSNCRCNLQTSQCDAVGSTAVVAVVTPEKIVVSNCGDCRAVLCRNGAAVPLSVDHKADRPDELVRIQEAGGRVIYWDGAKVLGVLSTSRAIGDNYLKPFVISEPEVTITDRTAEDEYLILASDGLWDVVSNDTACSVARMCLCAQKPHLPPMSPGSNAAFDAALESSDKACSDASILLTRLALARHSTDNVSVVVVDLRRNHYLSWFSDTDRTVESDQDNREPPTNTVLLTTRRSDQDNQGSDQDNREPPTNTVLLTTRTVLCPKSTKPFEPRLNRSDLRTVNSSHSSGQHFLISK